MRDPLNAAGLKSWVGEAKLFYDTKVPTSDSRTVSPIIKDSDSDVSFDKYPSTPKHSSTLIDCDTSIYNSCAHLIRDHGDHVWAFCEERYTVEERVDWLQCPVCNQWYHEICFHY